MWLLVVAGTIGVISPSGQEVGPFLPIEQAALSQVVPDRARTRRVRVVHAGGLDGDGARRAGRGLADATRCRQRWTPVDSYRAVVVVYAGARRRASPLLRVARVSQRRGSRAAARPSIARRRSPGSPARAVARRRAEAVRAVRARFVRRRLRRPELRRVLVLSAVRRRSEDARRDVLRRPTCSPACRRWSHRGWPVASG